MRSLTLRSSALLEARPLESIYRTSQLSPFLLQSGRRHASSIFSSSFWRSMVPKPLRKEKLPAEYAMLKRQTPRAKPWNPATFFIFMFLFVGSMAINMISLKKEFATFMRRADTRIGQLKEVIEKLQRGEKVDVERALGTGEPAREQEWEDVLLEIEREDLTKSKKKVDKKTSNDPPTDATAAATPTDFEPSPTQSKDTSSFF